MYSDLIKKIKEYDNIVIARHIGPDPDCLCSQLALRDSILLTYPEKKVIAVGMGSSRFLSFGRLDKYEKEIDLFDENCTIISDCAASILKLTKKYKLMEKLLQILHMHI